MARETIFEEQAVSGFWFADQYGMYAKSIMPAPFSLTAGEEYIVIWDNVEYPVTAVDISELFPGGVAVGNGSGFGLPGNNEPFIVAAFETDVTLFVLDPTDTRDTHSFGIYKSVEEAVYYTVSSLSLKAVGNAIRAKTGSSDVLSFPTGMVEAINGITGGGGGGSGDYTDAVYTVTFMNGSEFLYARAVADGDNCADVVSRGLVSTPTKASTAQYDYTHNGWSLTDGGSANSAALSNVTEDRTVYAAYSSAVRYYTITYYDSDGVTVLHTESLAYGRTPSYKPTKEDYILAGFEPALSSVTGDASYTAVWEEGLDFATMSFTEIDAAVKAGKAHYFKLGARKSFTGAKGHSMELQIVGINHDDLADGSGKAGLTLMFNKPAYACAWAGSAGSYKKYTWLQSGAYTGSNGAYYYDQGGSMNAELKSVLKTVSKKHYDFATSAYVSTDVKYFLPALCEITNADVRPDEGDVYEYFADGWSGKLSSNFGTQGIWTRTKTSLDGGYVYRVFNDGTYNSVSQGVSSSSPYNPQLCCI